MQCSDGQAAVGKGLTKGIEKGFHAVTDFSVQALAQGFLINAERHLHLLDGLVAVARRRLRHFGLIAAFAQGQKALSGLFLK